MSSIQDEVGPAAVTAVVSCAPADDADGGELEASAAAAAAKAADVHFEAFQVSAQCVKLNREGWLKPGNEGGENGSNGSSGSNGNGNGSSNGETTCAPSGVSRLVDPKEPKKKNPVIVAGKDASQVDNDYFLVPVPIRDHGGPLRSSFAVENRLLPQGPAELAAFLKDETGYQQIQGTKPDTLAMALADSPAGLAAWIGEHGRFPSTMVDRITPVTKPGDIADLTEHRFRPFRDS